MANTFQPTIGVTCPFCKRYIKNDANIVLDHIIYCVELKGFGLPEVIGLKSIELFTNK